MSTLSAAKRIIKLSASPDGFGETADELTADMFDSAIPIQHSHSVFECDEQGLYVGLWDTTDMIEAGGPYECDEFMVLLEGSVDIKNNKTGVKETVSAGESFILGQGYDCQWHQQGYLRKFYVIHQPPEQEVPNEPSVDGIVKVKTPKVGLHYQHKSFASYLHVFNTISRNEIDNQHYRFCYVNEGEIQTKDENGLVQLFTVGEAFFIPVGMRFSFNASKDIILHTVEIQPL